MLKGFLLAVAGSVVLLSVIGALGPTPSKPPLPPIVAPPGESWQLPWLEKAGAEALGQRWCHAVVDVHLSVQQPKAGDPRFAVVCKDGPGEHDYGNYYYFRSDLE